MISLAYKEQKDDEIVMEEVPNESSSQASKMEILDSEHLRAQSRFSFINFINHHQSRWQQNLHRQQQNIYQDHTMLN